MPLGNASPSATFHADPSGLTIATIPVASACPNGWPPLTYALPRPSTTSSFPAGGTDSSLRSPCVTSDPSGSLRKIRPSPPETTSRRPSGSQSTQHGNDGALRMTSLFPLRSTAITSCVPQSENHSRPSCQRGCSPKRMPVIKVLTNQPLLSHATAGHHSERSTTRDPRVGGFSADDRGRLPLMQQIPVR